MEMTYTGKASSNTPVSDSSLLRWFLQRLTGFILLACLAIHVIVLHFTHEPIKLQIVVNRIQSATFWPIFYCIFLGATMFHGLNGLYGIIMDYAPSLTLKRVLSWSFWIIGLIAFAWGLQVLLMFRIAP